MNVVLPSEPAACPDLRRGNPLPPSFVFVNDLDGNGWAGKQIPVTT